MNGEKVFLRGVHANTDSTISGRGMLRHYAVRDAELLQHLGANLLRNTGPPEALLDACDALGIVVFDELVHGLNKNGCERSSGPSASVLGLLRKLRRRRHAGGSPVGTHRSDQPRQEPTFGDRVYAATIRWRLVLISFR